MSENICKFVQTKRASDDINILCFVLEAQTDFDKKFTIPAANTVALAVSGTGILHTPFAEFPIEKGKLFFTFSAKPYYIENTGDLQYMYISFVGLRAQALLKRVGTTPLSPVYDDFDFITDRWICDLDRTCAENIDIVCESLLLYTLSYLCNTDEEISGQAFSDGIIRLKEYIDTHYTDSELNLTQVSRKFNYSPKYASAAFMRLVKCPFSEYIRGLRMEHARRLLAQGMSNVREIASSCGYGDPLYFSKVFKKHFGVSPKRYGR